MVLQYVLMATTVQIASMNVEGASVMQYVIKQQATVQQVKEATPSKLFWQSSEYGSILTKRHFFLQE